MNEQTNLNEINENIRELEKLVQDFKINENSIADSIKHQKLFNPLEIYHKLRKHNEIKLASRYLKELKPALSKGMDLPLKETNSIKKIQKVINDNADKGVTLNPSKKLDKVMDDILSTLSEHENKLNGLKQKIQVKAEKPAEKPTEKPSEKPAEKPAEKTAEKLKRTKKEPNKEYDKNEYKQEDISEEIDPNLTQGINVGDDIVIDKIKRITSFEALKAVAPNIITEGIYEESIQELEHELFLKVGDKLNLRQTEFGLNRCLVKDSYEHLNRDSKIWENTYIRTRMNRLHGLITALVDETPLYYELIGSDVIQIVDIFIFINLQLIIQNILENPEKYPVLSIDTLETSVIDIYKTKPNYRKWVHKMLDNDFNREVYDKDEINQNIVKIKEIMKTIIDLNKWTVYFENIQEGIQFKLIDTFLYIILHLVDKEIISQYQRDLIIRQLGLIKIGEFSPLSTLNRFINIIEDNLD